MKTICRTLLSIGLILNSLILISSCTKAPLNEVDGSYFVLDGKRVVFEKDGLLSKDSDGNLTVTCCGSVEGESEKNHYISVVLPESAYDLKGKTLNFSNSSDAKISFYTRKTEDVVFVHLQESAKVKISGTVTGGDSKDFFDGGNTYSSSLAFSFSLDDGRKIRISTSSLCCTRGKVL